MPVRNHHRVYHRWVVADALTDSRAVVFRSNARVVIGLRVRAFAILSGAMLMPGHDLRASDSRTYFKKHLLEVISVITDSLYAHGEHRRHPRDQQDQQRDTHPARSTVGTAAMLPHSKRRDTRLTSGQGNQSGA